MTQIKNYSSHSSTDIGERLNWQTIDLAQAPALQSDEIHLWCIPLQLNNVDVKRAVNQLSPYQANKYKRRSSAVAKQSYLAGRFYLQTLLAMYSNCATEKVCISYSRLNKPYLDPNPRELAFNFSDAKNTAPGDIGLYAFTCSAELGVDIELLSRRGEFARIAQRKLCAAELDWVKGTKHELIPERFLALWTRKEAYGKATGQGINFKMNRLNLVSPGSHELSFLGLGHEPKSYHLRQFLISNSHIASLVYSGNTLRNLRAFILR